MKWIALMIGLLSSSAVWAQEKEQFWYSMTNDYENAGLFTWADSTGIGRSMILTYPRNGWIPKDSTMYIANRADTSQIRTPIASGERGYHVATYWSEDSIELQPVLSRLETGRPSRTDVELVGKHIYFITLAQGFVFDQKIQFYKDSIDFGREYGPDFSLEVIQTDLQLNVLNARRYRGSFNMDSYAVYNISEDEDGQPQFTIDRFGAKAYDGFSLDKYTIYEDSSRQQFNIVRLHHNLQLDTVVTIKNTKELSTKLDWYFSIGIHFRLVSKNTQNRLVYVIQKLNKNFDIEVIDTIRTNLTINSFSIRNGRIWAWWHTAAWTGKKLHYINEQELHDLSPTSRVLSSFNRNGELKAHLPIRNCNAGILPINDVLGKDDDLYWLKLTVPHVPVFFGDSTFINDQGGSQILYLALDLAGNILQVLKGPKTDLAYGYPPAVHLNNGVLYDMNNFRDSFSYGSFRSSLPQKDFNRSWNLVYTENPVVIPPRQKPVTNITLTNCNTIQISHRRTDAEHYTLLVSPDSLHHMPQNGENYNYSYDYLKAAKLGKHTRVLYQGRDTSVKVYNLVAGRRYHFALVPGNGPAGNTAYNRDSIDTFSLYIPISPWQDSIAISPYSDTAICQSDSFYFSGKSPFALRWMDGKETELRMLEQSGNYYFTSKDQLECVLSSDTVQLLVHQLPEVYSLEVASAPPYCLGDTLMLRAKSSGDYLWLDGSTDSTLMVFQTGFYDLISRSSEGCETHRSIEVTFDQYPIFRFDMNAPILGYGGKIDVRYKSNADSLSWHIDGFTDTTLPKEVFTDSCLRVEAFSKTGCLTKDSIEIRNYELQASIFPNAFSPNGDGINDVWYFIHPDTLGELTIYNRWGAVVHTGLRPWDGTRLGERLPLGSYEYVFWYNNAGTRERLEGTIYLIR